MPELLPKLRTIERIFEYSTMKYVAREKYENFNGKQHRS